MRTSTLPARTLPARTLPTTHRGATRVLAVAATSGLLVLAVALPASAHVHALPDNTAAGGYSVVTVRVPNESDTASTVQLVLTLPQDTPLTFAAVQPVPGWTAQITEDPLPAPVTTSGATVTRAPHTVTWTAQPGAGIAPGQFQEFPLEIGPLPASGTTVLLPAVQTYSDGEVASWTEHQVPGAAEPEHPTPEFVTTAAVADDDAPAAAAVTAPSTTDTSDGVARGLGAAGLGLGAVALALAVRGRARRR